MTWTADDLLGVAKAHPGLRLRADGTLVGRLAIVGTLLKGGLVLNPTEEILAEPEAQEGYILDDFEIEVGSRQGCPYLKLPEKRLADTAAAQDIPIIDLHLYSDQTACTSSPQELEADLLRGLDAETFVCKYVLPFLYGQAYRKRHGRWPWLELSHGALGLLEWLGRRAFATDEDVCRTGMSILRLHDPVEGLMILSVRARRYQQCPCGSGKQLHQCHRDLKPAIDAIRGAMAQGRLVPLKQALCILRKHRAAFAASQEQGRRRRV